MADAGVWMVNMLAVLEPRLRFGMAHFSGGWSMPGSFDVVHFWRRPITIVTGAAVRRAQQCIVQAIMLR
jgi:hypothetical protein